MKKQKRKNYAASGLFFALFVIFTILVKVADVKPIGPQSSEIGFSYINKFVFEFLGQKSLWYNISESIGYAALLIAFAFAVFGFVQIIRRKSVLKTDFDILALGCLYILTVCAYIVFEIIVINYRPVLVNGVLEASYPSSHTMLALVIFGSAIMQIDRRINNKPLSTVLKAVMYIFIIATLFGRIASGMHWLTDVIGSVLLSAFLLTLYRAVIDE